MALCDFCTLLRVLIVSQKSNNNFIFTGAFIFIACYHEATLSLSSFIDLKNNNKNKKQSIEGVRKWGNQRLVPR